MNMLNNILCFLLGVSTALLLLEFYRNSLHKKFFPKKYVDIDPRLVVNYFSRPSYKELDDYISFIMKEYELKESYKDDFYIRLVYESNIQLIFWISNKFYSYGSSGFILFKDKAYKFNEVQIDLKILTEVLKIEESLAIKVNDATNFEQLEFI